MDENALTRLLVALEANTKAQNELTAEIKSLIASNAEVVDLLLGQMADVEYQDEPQYLGSRS